MNMARWYFFYWSSFSYRHKSDQNTNTTKTRKTAIVSNEVINWHWTTHAFRQEKENCVKNCEKATQLQLTRGNHGETWWPPDSLWGAGSSPHQPRPQGILLDNFLKKWRRAWRRGWSPHHFPSVLRYLDALKGTDDLLGDLTKSWKARISSRWRSNTPCTTPGSFLKPRTCLGCMNCECMQSYIWLINLLFHTILTFLYLWVKSSFSCSVHLFSKSALKSILSLLMRSSENKEERV